MNIEDIVIVRSEKGDIVCKDIDDAYMTIACCEIQNATLEKYEFSETWNNILKLIESEGYVSLRNLR